MEACFTRACVQPSLCQPDHFPKNHCPRSEEEAWESRKSVNAEQVRIDRDKIVGEGECSVAGRARWS